MTDSTEHPVPQPSERAALTHLDEEGQARMVEVGGKSNTRRSATARAVVELTEEVRGLLLRGELPKGEALAVALIAGIQAAKETSRLIPLCHPLALSGVEVRFAPVGEASVEVLVTARCTGPTGVEMEAMAGASVAALTLYDMCKAMVRGARIGSIELVSKRGGASGEWLRGSPE